jgi:hypothetical protein
MKTRVGKIARLPKKIREELNRRLEDGWTGMKLAEWLNSLPRVRKVLREQFGGQEISEQNLSRWKEGGYEDWLRRQESRERMQQMVESSDEFEEAEGDEEFCERLARIVTVELAEHVQRLREIEDPKERWKELREISHELWRLRTAASYFHSVGLGWRKWEREVDREEAAMEEERRQQAKQEETQEEYLERLMDILHRPDLREWVRTDFPSREAEMRRLKEIYHLKPDSKGTPFHPVQRSRDAQRRWAVYNYPNESKEQK